MRIKIKIIVNYCLYCGGSERKIKINIFQHWILCNHRRHDPCPNSFKSDVKETVIDAGKS